MSKLKLPQTTFFNDLYRDLRDRRLLIPVVALLVAIIAVPFLLGGGSEPAPVPLAPAATASADGAEALAPAVLTEQQVGVRDYRKRLAALKSKNPFEQKFALPSPEDVALGDSTSTSTSTSSTTTITGSSSSGTTSSTSSTGTDPSTITPIDTGSASPSTSSPSTGSTTPPSDSSDDEQPKPVIRFFASRVNVTVGPLGETQKMKGVKPLDLLPDDKAPVAAFLGLAGADSAVFSISRDVVESDGEGSCAPKKPSPCEFLTLKVGEERTFKYGPEGTPYRLKLLRADVVRVPDPRGAKPGQGKVAAQ